MKKTAVIIGAGPAGLTTAYELLEKTDIIPIILEKTKDIGGISKTVVYKKNRIDIGGHRFFSKSDVVMQWWQNIMPVQGAPSRDDIELAKIYPKRVSVEKELNPDGADPEATDRVMLKRSRLSRIFHNRKFFNYPLTLDLKTIKKLGWFKVAKIGFSYAKAVITPKKDESNLENFLINRFGFQLYNTFFKDYTEKVWGVRCADISSEWGGQRLKGLSITKTVLHALKQILKKDNSTAQKKVNTSLISQFLYPKLGPGAMWETVAEIVKERGAKIIMQANVIGVELEGNKIVAVTYQSQTGDKIKHHISADYLFSTMPVKELIASMGNVAPKEVQQVAQNLQYRDFITVGLLLNKMKIRNETKQPTLNNLIPDNWIYVQEKEVKIGRLQIFNNWSPYMVADPDKVWVVLEYFCNEGDALWVMQDKQFAKFAIDELAKIGIIDKEDVQDSTVIRMPKAYPAYFGSYDKFNTIKQFTDQLENLFLIGRNGMHKYNNSDHSMLTAIVAVQNIIAGKKTKENIWAVNTEKDYHEEKNT